MAFGLAGNGLSWRSIERPEGSPPQSTSQTKGATERRSDSCAGPSLGLAFDSAGNLFATNGGDQNENQTVYKVHSLAARKSIFRWSGSFLTPNRRP